MDNALRVDELWEPTFANDEPRAAPHLETNMRLSPVVSTGPQRAAPREHLKIPFLGHTILWTMDRDRPFPTWVAEALVQMLTFSELPANWDSYGGRGLQQGSVGPVLKLIMRIHQLGRQATLVPLPGGGVGLRLENGARELEIDVAANGSVEAILQMEGAEDVVVGPGATIAESEQLLDRFIH